MAVKTLKINELTKNILLSIIFIIIFLVIFEFLLRFFYFGENTERIEPVILMKSSNGKIFYEMKPNSYMMRGSINITINSKGMRDIEYSYNKPNGTYRIAVIGDSVTSAVYLNLSRSQWI